MHNPETNAQKTKTKTKTKKEMKPMRSITLQGLSSVRKFVFIELVMQLRVEVVFVVSRVCNVFGVAVDDKGRQKAAFLHARQRPDSEPRMREREKKNQTPRERLTVPHLVDKPNGEAMRRPFTYESTDTNDKFLLLSQDKIRHTCKFSHVIQFCELFVSFVVSTFRVMSG
jgi:hypothetical protein